MDKARRQAYLNLIESSSANSQLEFLLQVLQATSDSDGAANVIYPLLRDNLNLINDNLAAVLQNWGMATLQHRSQESRISLTAVIFYFSNVFRNFL
jgi:hypothetical protein